MPLPTLKSYENRKDYAADFKTSSVKAKSSVQPFRYIKAFEFESGKKQPLILLGKLAPGILEELKTRSGTGKVCASGLCRLVNNALQFEVEKGKLDNDEVADALTVANATALAKDAKVVDKLGDGSSEKARQMDELNVQHRFVKLVERVSALGKLDSVGDAIKPLQSKAKQASEQIGALKRGDIEAGAATVEELLDEFEQAIVAIERTFKDDLKQMRTTKPDASLETPKPKQNEPKAPDLKELTEAFNLIHRSVEEAEQRILDYKGDPNGFLLLLKKITSSDAAFKVIQQRLEAVPSSPEKAELELKFKQFKKQLGALGQAALEKKTEITKWSEHIEARKQALGADIGKKKYIEQEGEIGAEMEMSVGGLKRAAINQVEFEPGEFSPYKKQGDTEDPTDESPHQFDVFGITATVVQKVMPLTAKKVYPWLKAIEDEVLWKKLKNMTEIETVHLDDKAAQGDIDPDKIFTRYLTDAKFYAGLAHHFKKGLQGQEKPTVVPLDISGMKLWPALLKRVQSDIDTLFPKQKHLILWRD